MFSSVPIRKAQERGSGNEGRRKGSARLLPRKTTGGQDQARGPVISAGETGRLGRPASPRPFPPGWCSGGRGGRACAARRAADCAAAACPRPARRAAETTTSGCPARASARRRAEAAGSAARGGASAGGSRPPRSRRIPQRGPAARGPRSRPAAGECGPRPPPPPRSPALPSDCAGTPPPTPTSCVSPSAHSGDSYPCDVRDPSPPLPALGNPHDLRDSSI